MRSRMHVRGIGANTFTAPSPVACPPGYHDDGSGGSAIRGIGACVPDKVVRLRLRTAPSPAPPVMAPAPPLALPPPVFAPAPPAPPAAVYAPPSPAPSAASDFATAPTPPIVCPTPWSWWWLLAAAAAGGVLGYMAQKDKRKTKENVARLVNGAASRIVNTGAARLFR